MMVVRVNRKEILRYYTRESIKPAEWDPENKKAKEGKSYPEGWEINMRLQKYRLKFKSFFRELIDSKTLPTKALIKTKLDEEFFDFLERKGELLKYFEDYIARIKTNKLQSAKGKPYSKGTIETFNTALMHLKKYQEKKGVKLSLDGIDMSFYYDYLDYFYSANYSTNAIYNPIKKLKQVLSQAEQEGYSVNSAYRNRRFIAPQELTDKVYLNDAEILTIYQLKYELFSQIDHVRDRFILACHLGIRFGDYEEIRKENIFKNKHGEFVRVKAEKTGTVAIIPLSQVAKSILAKYNYKLPEVIDNTHFNDYLEDICKDAGINQDVIISSTRGGKNHSETNKKYELVKTHTARRSFATNLFLAGYSPVEIMKMTGHKTETEFLKYIRVSSEEVAFKIAQDPRFSKS